MKSALLPLVIASTTLAGSATWNLNPTSSDWNTAANWTPATVPNGPADVATFAVSNTTSVSLSASSTEVASIVFNPGASSFNITAEPETNQANVFFTVSGAGIVNNSGVTQNLVAAPTVNAHGAFIEFKNAASAGDGTSLTAFGSDTFGAIGGSNLFFYDNSTAGSASIVANPATQGDEAGGGEVSFYNNATAGNANVTINGALSKPGYAYGGEVNFFDSASAGDASFVINSGSGSNGGRGQMLFIDSSTAGNATFTLNGPTKKSGESANIDFDYSATAGNGFFTVNGGSNADRSGAGITFFGSSFAGTTSAGTATIINNGGNGAGSTGGHTSFINQAATASQAVLIANGGVNGGGGGTIAFVYGGDGGQARIELFGNGTLSVDNFASPPVLSVGSIEGDGLVVLESATLVTGANDLSTTFSGTIQEFSESYNGSLEKTGNGTLSLSGANIYTGGTTISAGTLLAKNPTGSATGTGAVQVSGGTLGGKGIISGATTIGTGSGTGGTLQPGKGASTATTLTIQNSLTIKSDGSYAWKLNTKKAKADQVIASGVTIDASAQFDLSTVGNKKLTAGKIFTAINNTATTPISGIFANLADGSTVTVGVNKLQVSYSGGDGNDLTLTVVP